MRKFLTERDIEKLHVDPGQQVDFRHAKEAGLGIRISYGGTKTFYVSYRFAKIQRRMTIGHYPQLSLSEAKTKTRAIRSDVDAGRDPAAEKLKKSPKGRSILFADVANDYIEKYAKPNNRSWKETQRTLSRYFIPVWKNLALQSIEKSMVRDVLENIVERGTLSAANQAFACIRKFFSWAVEHDRCLASPCETLSMPAKEVARERVLSDKEIAAIVNSAVLMGGQFGNIIQLLFYTAQRRTEVSGMRRAELDLSKRLWTLPSDRTKSAREHILPLSDSAFDLILGLDTFGDDLVFPARGRTDRSVSGFSKWKLQLDERCGVKNWRLHDIRRTVTTKLAELGTPLHVIKKILNHADAIPGVSGIYNRHRYLEESREALRTWEAELGRIRRESEELASSATTILSTDRFYKGAARC